MLSIRTNNILRGQGGGCGDDLRVKRGQQAGRHGTARFQTEQMEHHAAVEHPLCFSFCSGILTSKKWRDKNLHFEELLLW